MLYVSYHTDDRVVGEWQTVIQADFGHPGQTADLVQ
jgi:hypothetical protein